MYKGTFTIETEANFFKITDGSESLIIEKVTGNTYSFTAIESDLRTLDHIDNIVFGTFKEAVLYGLGAILEGMWDE